MAIKQCLATLCSKIPLNKILHLTTGFQQASMCRKRNLHAYGGSKISHLHYFQISIDTFCAFLNVRSCVIYQAGARNLECKTWIISIGGLVLAIKQLKGWITVLLYFLAVLSSWTTARKVCANRKATGHQGVAIFSAISGACRCFACENISISGR